MTITSKQKTVLAIALTTLGAIAPAFFSYLQATQETRAKYRQSHNETERSYDALAASVKDLQEAMLIQHDYVVKLEGQIAALTAILAQRPTSSELSGLRLGTVPELPKLERPPARPELPAPPDFEVVQMKR